MKSLFFGYRLRRLGSALLISLLFFQVWANATPEETAQSEIVALGYDAGSGSLLKVHPQALYRSENGGRDWVSVPLPPSVQQGRIAAVATPADGTGVIYLAGPGLGVLRSEDGDKTWTARNEGLPGSEVTVFTTHATQTHTLYAFLPEHGIFRSKDAGESWQLMDRGPPERLRDFIHSDMPGSMQTGWLFAATGHGVSRSMDCFCLWSDAGGLIEEIDAVTYDPRQPQQIYAATGEGLLWSTNGGEDWERILSPGEGITALVFTPSGELYAGTDKGKLFRRIDQANGWEPVD